MNSARRIITTVALAGALGIGLTACGQAASTGPDGGSGPSTSTTARASGATPRVTTTARPTAAPTTAPTSASTGAGGTASSPSASGGAGSTSGSGSVRSSRCTTAHLSGTVGERDGAQPGTGAGMSQEQVAIILRNTGTVACTLQGWPGVSYVGHSNGTQLGAAAAEEPTAPHPTVTIQPGRSAQAYVDFEAVAAFPPDQCKAAHADGIRVYPPGSTTSLFIAGAGAGNGDACTGITAVTKRQIVVEAFIPYP